MEYKDALKQFQAKKLKDNFLVIELSYSCKLLLPFKDGMVFMASLVNAEKLNDNYSDPHRIVPVERDMIKTSVMSADEYELFKIAGLLNVTPEEVKTFALAASP